MDTGFVVFHYWAPAYGDLNGRSTKVDERMTNGKRKEAQANGIDFSHIHRVLEGEELRWHKTLLVP